MKIANSYVNMASSHALETQISMKKASIEVQAKDGEKVKSGVAAIYKGSGVSAVAAMEQYSAQEKFAEAEVAEQPARHSARRTPGFESCPLSGAFEFHMDEMQELKVKLLNKMLEALGGKARIEPVRIEGLRDADALDLRGETARAAGFRAQSFSVSAFSAAFSASSLSFTADRSSPGGAAGTTSAGTLWQRVDAVSVERSEREYTTFQSNGYALTEDGRSINFGVEVEMSRAFTSRFDAISSKQFVLTDPLVINLGSNMTSVGDAKFRFDLDADGKEEEISFAGEGSGFLALDADGNGKIDDGSELFGTKSGDGFADLAAHDSDGNGWIDENDPVYSKLRVWVKDADGGDRLLDLKEADVGAIYLGSAGTEFSLNDASTNETNAVIRKTGVYLKESGGAGTLSHVDLRC